jgi:ATP-dependent Lhr-like helicase
VWKGYVTNDSFRAVRAYLQPAKPELERRTLRHGFRSRRQGHAPRASEGRWSLLSTLAGQQAVTPTERADAWAQLLLRRYGIVTREVAQAERITGGFSALYDVFTALEDAGRIRRGYFVQGVSAMQFALPSVLDQLRALRTRPEHSEVITLSATDPANPYGALLPWPEVADGRALSRAAQALVLCVDGALAAYLSRTGRQLQVFLPESDPERARVARAISERLREIGSDPERRGLMIAEIDAGPAHEHAMAEQLKAAGFQASSQGFYLPRTARGGQPPTAATDR